MTVVLVTGGRDYTGRDHVEDRLKAIHLSDREVCFVQGGANGVDRFVREWCKKNGVPCATMEAHWDFYGKPAGGMRNGWMLKYLRPNYVVHFPGGPGTANMVKRARDAGVSCYAG